MNGIISNTLSFIFIFLLSASSYAVDHSSLSTVCFSCHDGSTASAKPNNHWPTTNKCESCHSTLWWNPIVTVNHYEVTGQCIDCHNSIRAPGKPTTHPSTTDACDQCHFANQWLAIDVDHNQVRGTCISCHDGSMATGKHPLHSSTTDECHHCHSLTQWVGAIEKTVCENCHNGTFYGGTVASSKSNNHLNTTNICSACHVAFRWSSAVTVDHAQMIGICFSCHNGTMANGQNLTHFETSDNCNACHSTNAWLPAHTFDHTQVSGSCSFCHDGVQATGKHNIHMPASNECNDCHHLGSWVSSITVKHVTADQNELMPCIHCHDGVSAGTKGNKHIFSSVNCSACHSVVQWNPIRQISHDDLEGSECTLCHNSLDARGKGEFHIPTVAECDACHNSPRIDSNITQLIPGTDQWIPVIANAYDFHFESTLCVNCHISIYDNTLKVKPGNHPPTSEPCDACHIPIQTQPNNQIHILSQDQCDACHFDPGIPWYQASFSHTVIDQSEGCQGCHNGNDATAPAGTHWSMGNDINQYCDFCHSTSEWVPALRGLDYIKPLSHADWSNACGACHLPSSEVVSEAPEFHQTLGLDGECGDCHNANNSNVSFPSYNNNRDYFAPYVVAVGATKLQVSVSNKGAANISLSISKAPGINSLAPDVSLDYDSNTPNGLFGVGWQLNGLSRIARCRPTLAQDNLVDNVDYDENDRFCLDGERLIEIENKTFPGTCEVGDSINKQYITETNKYSRIISCGTQGFGPKYFRAWSKSGNLFEYGTSNDSKIESNNRFGIDTQTNTDSVIIWSLKRVSDQKSNHFYISYSKTINLGPETANPPYTPVVHHYPESINYSGNKNTNLSTSRSINFEYTNRFDIENSYVAQVKLEVPKRISKIVTKINGRTVREYRFRYEYSSATQRSILSEILECAQDTSNITCFNPTKFDWQDNQNALQTPVAIPDFTGRNIKYTSAGDFNGDGIGDLFYPYGGSWRVLFGKNNVDGSLSFSTEVNTGIGYGSDEEKYSAVLDYNANGISDFLVPGSTQDGYSNWIVISYDNNQFVKTNTGISSGAYTLGFGVADINADGYDDLIYSELDISNSHQYLSLLRNSANGFSVGSNIHYATQPGGSANTRIEGRPEILRWSPIDLILVGMGKIDRELDKGKTIGSSSMDFNGDGRADLVVNDIVTNTCDLFLSQAQNNNSDFLWVGSLGKCDDILPMDINGDQITDWLTTGARTGMFSAGVGISVPLVGMTNSATTKYMIPVDLNLDGKTDYIFPDQGQFTYRLSNGTRFRSVNSGVPAYISSSCLKEGETYCYAENTRTVDINGDGFYDIVTQSGNSWYVYENRVSGVNNTIDKIVGINHGLGNTATFTYDSTAIIEDYQPSSVEPNYPIVEYRAPNKVVTRLSTDLFVNNYYYQGSKYDRLRRQYLGFEKQTTKSESTQIFNERSFYQEYPLTGLQKHFDSFYYKDPSDLTTKVLLTSNNSTIASNKATVANQSYYDVYTTQSVEKNYDLDGVLQSTKTIEYQDIDGNNTPLDAYGNVEKIQITLEAGGIFNDKFIETKEFLYTPIITNDVWLTGLMSRSSSVTKNKDNVQSNPRSIGFTYYSSGSSHYGMLHCKTQQPDDPLLRLKTCFTYDDYGNILTTELEGFDGQYDENGVAINTTVLTKRIAKAEYTNGSINANLQTVAMTEDFGVGRKNLLTTHTIDARFGESTSIEDENGLTTRIQFDSFGRVKIETRVNDSYVETELNTNCTLCSTDLPYSQRKTEYSPSNEVIRSELTIYDKLLRPRITRTVGFDGTQICQSKQYYEAGHEKGRLKKESIPYDCETDTEDTVAAQYYEYDLLGRLIKVTKPDGTVAITNYAGITPDGFLSTVSRERKGYNGNTTVSTTTLTEKTYKNVKDWIIKVTDHDNSSNLYQHDPVGNIQHVIVANQERYTVSTLYDALGRKQTLSDPNLGTRLFRYNAFGDLIWQKDNNDNGTITKIKYDTLGRQIEREYFQIRENETAYTSTLKETWQYDTSVNGLGELASTSNTNGFNAVYTYEAEHGNVETVTKTLNGNEYTLTYQYDENGREEYIVYPQSSSHSALIVHKQYKADFLETICQVVNTTDTCNSVNSKLIWQANNYTFDGKIGNETRGRIATNFAYSENTGFLEGIHGQLDTTTVLDHSFEYDSLGNLESRTDSKLIWWDSDNHNAQQQKFSYDNLNRLSNVKINNQIYRSYEYDEVGNVTYRSDVGYYSYGQGNAGPNAVTSIGSVSNPQSIVANPVPGDANADGMITGIDIVYATNHLLGIKDAIGNPKCKNGTEVTIEDLSCITSHVDFQGAQQGVAYYYDNNGNLTYSNGRHLRYTPYNKPSLIKKEGTSVSFSYDSDHNRYQKNVDKQGDISKVLYFGKLFELYVSSDGTEQTKNYVHVNGQTVALINHDNVASFMHTDHLGSVVAITNEGGSILARYAYDPFGARVNAKWDDYETTSGSQNSITNRSFTQHEYLDDLGFIHMNGRVFDPAVGRFVSADPYIQFVYSSQGFNRYTYVSNNPLSYTDPTGYKVCPRSPTECTWAAIEIVVGGALIAAGYITPCSIVCYSIGTFLFIDGNDRFFNNPSYWETFWGDVGFEVGGEINTDGTGGSLEVSATSNSGGIRNNKFTIVKWEFYFGNYYVDVPPEAVPVKHFLPHLVWAGVTTFRIFVARGWIFRTTTVAGTTTKLVSRVKDETTVIGRVKDLQKLNKGEKSLLDRLPNRGNAKANWKQNAGVFRQEMKKRQPIRDASPGDNAGQFLNAERNLLRDNGWTFDPKTNYWYPPK